MANVLITVQVVDDQTVPVPVDGVLVSVHDGVTRDFITEGVTGTVTPGVVEFSLPESATYRLWPYLLGLTLSDGPSYQLSVATSPMLVTLSCHLGSESKLTTFTVQSEETIPQPVEGYRVRLFDSSDLFMTDLLTDAQGKAEYMLIPNDYIVRLAKSGWTTFPGPTAQFTVLEVPPVGSTNTFDFTAQAYQPGESNDPRYCKITGYLIDASGRAMPRVRLRCTPVLASPNIQLCGFPGAGDPASIDGRVILNEVVFESDSAGYIDLMLPRNSIYDVHIHGYENPGIPQYGQIYVPDAAGADLQAIIFPYVTSIVFDKPSLSLVVGASDTIAPTATGSNGQILQTVFTDKFLEFTPVDPAVISVSMNNGVLAILALAVGTTALQCVRRPDTFVNRVPVIPGLVATYPTITVTA
jgi:hypothetical protein